MESALPPWISGLAWLKMVKIYSRTRNRYLQKCSNATRHYFLSETPDVESRLPGSKWTRECVIGLFQKWLFRMILASTHFDYAKKTEEKGNSIKKASVVSTTEAFLKLTSMLFFQYRLMWVFSISIQYNILKSLRQLHKIIFYKLLQAFFHLFYIKSDRHWQSRE